MPQQFTIFRSDLWNPGYSLDDLVCGSMRHGEPQHPSRIASVCSSMRGARASGGARYRSTSYGCPIMGFVCTSSCTSLRTCACHDHAHANGRRGKVLYPRDSGTVLSDVLYLLSVLYPGCCTVPRVLCLRLPPLVQMG